MKILYFHQYFSPPSGNFGARPYELARRLIGRGHSVTMVCGSHDRANLGLPLVRPGVREGMIDGIRVIEFELAYSNYQSLTRRSLVFAKYAWRGMVLALREDYDLLFASSTPLTASLPGIAMKLFRRKPFVFEVRDLWPELPKAMGVVRNPMVLGLMSVLEKLSYIAADASIGLAPGIVAGIRRRSRKEQPIAMVPNACDIDLFMPGRREDLDLTGVEPTDFVAVFTGAHGVANGLDAVLDAAVVLREKGRTDIKIVFIGDGKQKPILKRRTESEGLTNCLFFDPVPKTSLAQLLGSVDAGLMILQNVPAFYYGTSPNKFFDYISAGLPVVTNYPGWGADLIREHGCGLAVSPGRPDELAEALIHLADAKTEREEIRVRARSLAETKFSRSELGKQFVDWLEQAHTRYWKDVNRAGAARSEGKAAPSSDQR